MLPSDQPQFTEEALSVIQENDSLAAMRLAKVLLQDVSSAQLTGSSLSEKQALLAQLYAVALPFLTQAMVEELFEFHPVDALSVPATVNVIENLKTRLLDEPTVEDKNAMRDLIKAAILRSPQQLGNFPLQLGTAEVPPTISNWMKLYIAEVGNDRTTTIKLARFFSQNRFVQRLSPQERPTLRALTDFYEYLKKRSDQLDGFEGVMYVDDENGHTQVITDGKVTPVVDKEDIEFYKQQARERTIDRAFLWSLMEEFPNEFKEFEGTDYRPKRVGPIDAAAVTKSMTDFLADQRTKFAHRVPATGVPLPNRTAALVAMLHKAMARGQEADMVLAKEILQYVLSDNDRFVNFMRHQSVINLLQTELPPGIGEKNKEVIRQSPTTPMALQALLQIVFLQRFKLSPEEAAWQSFDVIQKMPALLKELKTVVTYDPGQNKLVWRYG